MKSSCDCCVRVLRWFCFVFFLCAAGSQISCLMWAWKWPRVIHFVNDLLTFITLRFCLKFWVLSIDSVGTLKCGGEQSLLFASTLCMMVFEEGENADFTLKVVRGDQMLQVNNVSCFSAAQTFVSHCFAVRTNISAAWLWNEGSATNRIMFKKMVQTLH